MSSLTLAAVRPRHGMLCALASLALLSSPLASASTSAPGISGSPATSVLGWHTYSFTPKATAPSGYKLTFSISGKPAWAGFNTATGALTGMPQTANVGSSSTVVISVSDGAGSASLPAFTLKVMPNVTPTVSGAPATAATVATAYSFTPKANEPDGDPLSFSVKNKPSWASFSIATGTISGTPTAANVGTYSNIVITASTGHASASLAAFSIAVKQAAGTSAPSTGAVTVSWLPPTENVNGSALTNLAGYHIYYGTSQTNLNQMINVTNPGLAAYVVSGLAAATWYFSLTSINSNGVESPRTAVMSHVVP
jgi:Putative Ig domain